MRSDHLSIRRVSAAHRHGGATCSSITCTGRRETKPVEVLNVDSSVPVCVSVFGELFGLYDDTSLQERSLQNYIRWPSKQEVSFLAALGSPQILLTLGRAVGSAGVLRFSQTAQSAHKAVSSSQAVAVKMEIVSSDVATVVCDTPILAVTPRSSAMGMMWGLFRFIHEAEGPALHKPRVTDFIYISDISVCIAWTLGIAMVRRLRMTSKTFADGLRERLAELAAVRAATVYVCGGNIGGFTSTVDRLDLATGRWEAAPPMSIPRHACTAVCTHGQLYVFGGAPDISDRPERFDPVSNTWQFLPPMGTPLSHSSAAVADNYIYIFGGLTIGKSLSVVQRFDTAREEWQYMLPLTVPRFDSAALSLDGILYIFGGAHQNGYPLALCERFYPERQEWEPLPCMNCARHGCAAARSSRMLYVFGGGSTELLCVVEYLDVDARTWGRIAPMPLPRKCFGAVATAGRLYVFGGVTSTYDSADAVDCFDPSMRRWFPLVAIPTARSHCCAVAVDP